MKRAYSKASRNFLAQSTNRVEILKTALRGRERPTALTVARGLTQEEKLALFPEWVFLASWAHGAVQTARDILASLPRAWVLERIEREAEPYLAQGTCEEF